MKRLLLFATLGMTLCRPVALEARPGLLSSGADPADFPLVRDGEAATFVLEPSTDRAVARAAGDLRDDVAAVSGVSPPIASSPTHVGRRPIVLVGIAGHSALLGELAAAGKIDLQPLAGAWESYLIRTVPSPFPGVANALVVAGSDRRGAIYGLYELSEAIGVSPWRWWADVPPRKTDTLTIAAGTHRFGPPAVKYRGIFLNDEDWGLRPWAAQTFDPKSGNIGPKTYARVFELLLRLKANTLWPAMHPGTRPFNADPRNAALADACGIVMGSSHAEPMLRNNVGEWTAPHEDYDYVTHADEVRRYWEDRVAANGRFESIYTLGMRGIHDSEMQGPTTDAERIRTLERVFADQRAMIGRHVRPDVERVPQLFCAYKEVLALYRQGLRVPDDVTIVWPDDNFGYIRDFATPAERGRSGGFGVYYHLSYLGRPLAYLWLCTTPPALIWEEMRKACDHGANRIWIANVGDLKPAEIATEFFLRLAWDVDRSGPDAARNFLHDWSARTFGAERADAIASILGDYYRLNSARKPEHLQWWLPDESPRPSGWTPAEIDARLAAFATLRERAQAVGRQLPREWQDAFFELIAYPVAGSALANERYFAGERAALAPDSADATRLAARAREADAALRAETRRYDTAIAGGKWNHLIALEPADDEWRSMRIAPWTLPTFKKDAPPPAPTPWFRAAAGDFDRTRAGRTGTQAVLVPGLGRTGRAVTAWPFTAADAEPDETTTSAPRLDYKVDAPAAGVAQLTLEFLPTHPLPGRRELRVAVAFDDEPPRTLRVPADDGNAAWAAHVLDGRITARVPLSLPAAGPHRLTVFLIQTGVVLDRIRLSPMPGD